MLELLIACRGPRLVALGACALLAAACGERRGKTAFEEKGAQPDVLPVVLSKDLPFRYPASLYAEKVQGNVTLRLFIDTTGNAVDDSTVIVESSSVPLLDSAAVRGSRELRFVPAKLHGAPVAVSILFPVYFRHPDAPPPAGDTILRKVPLPDSAAAKVPSTTKKP